MNFQEVEHWAKVYDSSLLATDERFRHVVSVCHEDGSVFKWKNAFLIKLAEAYFARRSHYNKDEWVKPECGDVYIVVFTEHFSYHVFDSTDISFYEEFSERVRHDYVEYPQA